MIPKEFETISEYVCKQTRWTDGSIRHDRMEDVVRCKDCIVFGTHGKNTDICPMWHNTHIDPYRDFCSRGVRKTESSSEKPNNCEHITEDGVTCAKYPACDDCLDNPLNKVKGSQRLVKGSKKPNNCEDEPQTVRSNLEPFRVDEPQLTAKCLNCANGGSYKCSKCDGEMYFKDEPQTDNGIGCSRCEGRFDCYDRDMPHAVRCNNYGKITDEPQTERSSE